jgi:hypothetical protein
MPQFLESKLKEQYGANSDVPYKIMNTMGVMYGNKITAKGRALEQKHEHGSIAALRRKSLPK